LKEIHHQGVVSPELSGKRLDQVLARLFSDYSRSRLQGWIREGRVQVDGRLRKAKEKVWAGEQITLRALLEDRDGCEAEDIPLDLLYEDEHLLVVNKPAGLVVHPAAGNWSGTLQNALLHHDPELVKLPRAGIVHRLDKDTTGLMVVARSLPAHKRLVEALQAREIKREYMAVVNGLPTAGGTVDAPIGRHPVNRVRMAVVAGGKPARTHFRISERFRAHTLLGVRLESGRTHQIRVHMAYVRHPLVGDPVYGGRLKLPPAASEELRSLLRGFGRQALHARRLSLVHPLSGEGMSWVSPVPEDLAALLEGLRRDVRTDGA
jgi:23S rRNA pseudouridine1911/1915/1917 synthase